MNSGAQKHLGKLDKELSRLSLTFKDAEKSLSVLFSVLCPQTQGDYSHLCVLPCHVVNFISVHIACTLFILSSDSEILLVWLYPNMYYRDLLCGRFWVVNSRNN